MNIELTRTSSKGQIVLPAGLRKNLDIRPGTKFAVYGRDDIVILKKLTMPTVEEFDRLTAEMTRIAKNRGIRPGDVQKIVHKARGLRE